MDVTVQCHALRARQCSSIVARGEWIREPMAFQSAISSFATGVPRNCSGGIQGLRCTYRNVNPRSFRDELFLFRTGMRPPLLSCEAEFPRTSRALGRLGLGFVPLRHLFLCRVGVVDASAAFVSLLDDLFLSEARMLVQNLALGSLRSARRICGPR
jgi:hypothetical protein